MQRYFADEMARIGCGLFTPAAALLAASPDAAGFSASHLAAAQAALTAPLASLAAQSPDIFAVILTEGAV